MFKIGDIVTRKKYGHDILFKINKIVKNKCELCGLDVRLLADANIDDLELSTYNKKKEKYRSIRELNTGDYYFIPGSILHIDSDDDYIERSKEYYKENKLTSYCFKYNENEYRNNVKKLLLKYKPNNLVETGHDAYNKKEKSYKNSKYYIETVAEARKILDENKLTIVAGACQSDFKSIIKNGASFASSPSHINIHALDPAIVASYAAFTDKN